jgi:hypothetical protein
MPCLVLRSLAASNALILPTHTPGARYSKVTQATIGKTVCVKGWTKTIRPPTSYTNKLKRQQLAQWHYADQNPSHYEEDHLISLELGGAPRSKRNLWPEPHSQSAKSDPKENAWHRKLCNGTRTLSRRSVWSSPTSERTAKAARARGRSPVETATT